MSSCCADWCGGYSPKRTHPRRLHPSSRHDSDSGGDQSPPRKAAVGNGDGGSMAAPGDLSPPRRRAAREAGATASESESAVCLPACLSVGQQSIAAAACLAPEGDLTKKSPTKEALALRPQAPLVHTFTCAQPPRAAATIRTATRARPGGSLARTGNQKITLLRGMRCRCRKRRPCLMAVVRQI